MKKVTKNKKLIGKTIYKIENIQIKNKNYKKVVKKI